jgi:tRNA (guanosine-2'-O-)-methyltransferase
MKLDHRQESRSHRYAERPSFVLRSPQDHQSCFPYRDVIQVGKSFLHYTEVLNFLGPFLTDQRKERIQSIVQRRSFHIVPVLDQIYDEGNISAVWRSADHFGFQSVHTVSSQKTRKVRSVSRGSENWLDLYYWNKVEDCLNHHKSLGYKIVGTVIHPKAKTLEQLVTDRPLCLVFGNEKEGLSSEVLKMADEWCSIPSIGFTQSLNISVAAGIIFHHFYQQRHQSGESISSLSQEQQGILKAEYYLRSVHTVTLLLEHYLDGKNSQKKNDRSYYFEQFQDPRRERTSYVENHSFGSTP